MLLKKIGIAAFAALALVWSAPAKAQTQSGCKYIVYGAVLTPAQWNWCFQQKQDALGYTPVNKAGDIMTGELFMKPSNTASAGLNLGAGAAPTSPINGDFWSTSAGFFGYANGATVGPFGSAAVASVTAANSSLTISPTTGAVLAAINLANANVWGAIQTFTLAPVFTDQSGTRTALGLGTAATQNTGTSGATLPFLNGTNTWGGSNGFQAITTTSESSTGAQTIFSATAIPAGGTAGSGYKFSSTSNFGAFFGSGVPTLSAAQGSLYLRSDGAASTLVYVNTNGTTGWSALGAAGITALTGDGTATGPGSVALTLATVNSNVGSFGSATQSGTFTVNGKGLITAAANATITPAVGSITGFGTGVATALAINVGSAGAFVTFNGAGGTPSSMTATNLSGTAASLTAGNVTTNANLTGDVTSVGNAATLASSISGAKAFTTSFAVGGCTIGTNALCATGTAAISSTLTSAAHTITSASATALTVGLNGATNPALLVDASTATSATGLKIKSAAAAGGLALSVVTSGTNENLTIDAAGSGTIILGATSTGAITLTRATTLSAALTYGGVALSNAVTGTGNMVLSASPTLTGTLTASVGSFSSTLGAAATTITSASATALTVGLNGATNPAFAVDASTASQAAGLKITGAATGGTVAVAAIDSGSNTNLTVNAKGSGTIGIGSVSTGAVTITPATTLSAALTYGGVTLSNAVTGTGNMVLSASPTLTGTLTASVGSFSSTLASTAHTITSASATALTVGLNGATNPAFTIDASTASQAAGFKITGAATAGTVALVATDSGSNTNITINAKGSGTIGIGSVSTGAVTITPATTLSNALTYGGVALSNAVTGTGNMMLSASPTTTGTLTAAAATFSGTVTLSGGLSAPLVLAQGGSNANLTASNGGIVYSDASKMQILAGTVTASQCLLSGSNAAPTWGSCSGAAAVSSVSNSDTTLTISPTTGAVVASLNLAKANTWTATQTISAASFTMSGNISAAAWTTAGLRYKNVAASYTDTSSSGTVATAYTDLFPASTILASSSTTYTNYFGSYFVDPVASTNVTMTNKFALGADSAKIGTSNQLTISTAGLVTVPGTINVSGTFQIGGNAMTFPAAAATLTQTIVSGTSALGTGAIASAACAVVTTSATGTATTDTIQASFNGDPTGVTGYVPLTTGMLTIIGYPTANNVNWKVCNNTAASITPGAITLNWRVAR